MMTGFLAELRMDCLTANPQIVDWLSEYVCSQNDISIICNGLLYLEYIYTLWTDKMLLQQVQG